MTTVKVIKVNLEMESSNANKKRIWTITMKILQGNIICMIVFVIALDNGFQTLKTILFLVKKLPSIDMSLNIILTVKDMKGV